MSLSVCEDSDLSLNTANVFDPFSKSASTRVQSRVPVCFTEGLLGRGLERGHAGRAFSFFLVVTGGPSPGKSPDKKMTYENHQ